MATYFARDGSPVTTAFALPVNHRGEVTRYTTYGKQRLYTKARLEELDRRAAARKAPQKEKRQTMSEHALALAKQDFQDFCTLYAPLIEGIETHHTLHETLATYWQAINMGLPLSRREASDALTIIRRLHHKQ